MPKKTFKVFRVLGHYIDTSHADVDQMREDPNDQGRLGKLQCMVKIVGIYIENVPQIHN